MAWQACRIRDRVAHAGGVVRGVRIKQWRRLRSCA
jgi:hypothetical protein